MNKRTVLITLLLIVTTGILLVFTKPGGRNITSEKKESVIKDITDTFDILELKKNGLKSENSENSLKRVFKKPEQQNRIEKRYRKHGDNAVLTIKKRIEIPKKDLRLPVTEADWNSVKSLTYNGLKKIYLYRKLKKRFPREVVQVLNGAAVEIIGAVMPIDIVPKDGSMQRFWLANPIVVMAGCVFCNPPTLADLLYVEIPAGHNPIKIDRERLYKDIVMIKVKGQFFIGSTTAHDGTQSLFQLNYYDHDVLY